MNALAILPETETISITKACLLLCEALRQNYIEYSIKSHQKFIHDADTYEYHQKKISDLKDGICDVDFLLIGTGRRYHKIIMVDSHGHRSVHCFVDKHNGDLYKAASWKAPAEHVRGNLMNDNSREMILSKCDWAGSYLYLR